MLEMKKNDTVTNDLPAEAKQPHWTQMEVLAKWRMPIAV